MKKFDQLEQQESYIHDSEPKSSERVRISPWLIAIICGIILIAVVGFIFLFKGTGKKEAESDTSGYFTYAVVDDSNSKPTKKDDEQTEQDEHIYENGEFAEIETYYGNYRIAVTKAEILPSNTTRDAVYQITWTVENIDFSSDYNTEGILINPTLNFSVYDSENYILPPMPTGNTDDWVNQTTTVAPGKKCESKYTYRINNPECEYLNVELKGMDIIIGQGATFKINVINNASIKEENNNAEEEYGENIWHSAVDGKYKFRVYGYDPQSTTLQVEAQDTTTQQMYHGQTALLDADKLAKAQADAISFITAYKVGDIETIEGGFKFNVFFNGVRNGVTDPKELAVGITMDQLESID